MNINKGWEHKFWAQVLLMSYRISSLEDLRQSCCQSTNSFLTMHLVYISCDLNLVCSRPRHTEAWGLEWGFYLRTLTEDGTERVEQ